MNVGASSPVTVDVSNGGSPLPLGSYTLISHGTGTVSGVPGGTLTVAGDGANGATSLALSSGDLVLVVSPSTPTHLAFGQEPGNTIAGEAINPAVTVQVLDTYGNVVSSDNSTKVTLAIGTNPSSGTLTGGSQVTVTNGVATFSSLSIDKPGTGYTLTATDTTGGGGIHPITGDTSTSFNITANVSFSPSPLTFDPQLPAVPVTKDVTFTYLGSGSMTISSITASGDSAFSIDSTDCPLSPSTLAANTPCTIHVTFTAPVAYSPSVAHTGQLVVTDDKASSPHDDTLQGSRTAWQPLSFDIGFVPVGTTVSRTIKLYNVGTASITIAHTGLAISSSTFGIVSQSCTDQTILVLNASSYCQATISFTPAASGAQSSVLSVTDVNGVVNQAIVKGTGIFELGASPTSLSFGSIVDNTPSASKVVTLTNANGVAVAFTATSGDAEYTTTNTCGGSVPAASGPATPGTCTVNVTFTPTSPGSHPSTLTFPGDADYAPSVSLSGTGISTEPPPSLPMQLSATYINFGYGVAGTPSAAQFVTLANGNASDISLTGISFTGNFARSGGTCAASVPHNSSCTIGVSFNAQQAGANNGSMMITSTALGSPHTVTLQGNGTVPISVTPGIGFGYVPATTSVVQTVTVTNGTPASTTIAALNFTGYSPGRFSIDVNNCAGGVPANNSCTIDVRFAPGGLGIRSAYLMVAGADIGTTASVTLSGTGVATADLRRSPTSLSFGNVAVASPSQMGFTIYNPNGVDVTGIGLSAYGGPDFALSPPSSCGSTLGAGASCTVYLTFTPSSTGAKYGGVIVTWSGPTSGSTGVVASGRGY